ncbi:unnamed protein product [Ectocarpus sp. CCAP 1310/34]|nr:unnamed protein product [Ectocarpus sp. CCAP 1310/34]
MAQWLVFVLYSCRYRLKLSGSDSKKPRGKFRNLFWPQNLGAGHTIHIYI